MIDQTSMTLKNELHDLIEWLSMFGKTKNGGVTRLLYDAAWQKAQYGLKQKMEDMDLETRFDDAGNLFGRVSGRGEDKKVILTGSHVDTVVDGGKYDGAYGVLASTMAASRLFHLYGPPKQTIEAVSLCEEEGSRFPLSFWGSGTITGKYKMESAAGLLDRSGISLAEAMQSAGFGKGNYPQPVRQDIACFLETHIEQGRTLELEQKTWAPVSAIVGQRRYTISLTGESNHAGTTPMNRRHDAVFAASLMIAHAIQEASHQSNGLVATAGRVEADPNVPNVISGKCRFSLDVRHHELKVMDHFCEQALAFFKETADNLGIRIHVSKWMDAAPVKLDPRLTQMNLKIADHAGIPFRKMISGAGHDSQIFGTYCPTALMFVPSHLGISHSPSEYTRLADLEVGVRMLMKVLYQLAY
ncbi:Zn-dependent hydrolase [Sporolactobacillus vineae]|uniref:Zn-dependent hydrolase n=1 Tax=Sporolactobacillus vineae TaxID=444463 RepID=UPI0002882568|nr:Zn-dependent hydrolase [Sporolactobacillus vineae]